MRITITGGAGYIGSMLAQELSENHGHDVTVFDNFYYNQDVLTSRLFNSEGSYVRLFVSDILDWSVALTDHIHNCDVLIPLAALVGAPLCDKEPELAQRLNSDWFKDLLEVLNGNTTVIFPNSNSGYGSNPDVCTEETLLNPLSHYARVKCEAESYLGLYEKSIRFRLATVFGRSYRTRTDLLVNNLVQQAMLNKHIDVFDGHFRRNYIHVRDIVSAFVFAIENREKMHGEIYNLGNDEINTTKLELVKKVCGATDALYTECYNKTDPDKRDYIVSSQKLYDLGYECQHDLDYGIKEMVDYYNMFRNY
jgi:nucleoside-diphosphate-sugar epimerase